MRFVYSLKIEELSNNDRSSKVRRCSNSKVVGGRSLNNISGENRTKRDSTLKEFEDKVSKVLEELKGNLLVTVGIY